MSYINLKQIISGYGSEDRLLSYWCSLLESFVYQTGLDDSELSDLNELTEVLHKEIDEEMKS